MLVFSPPTIDNAPRIAGTISRPAHDLWSRVRRPLVGQTVLKYPNGSFKTVSYPTQDDLAAASFVYLGGHDYPVSVDEASELVAAGYSVPGFDNPVTSIVEALV